MEQELFYAYEDISKANTYGKKMGENLYFLEESEIFSDRYKYGQLVRTKTIDGEIWIDEIVQETEFLTTQFLLPQDVIHSDSFQLFTEKLTQLGGAYDIAMASLVSFYIPKSADFDLEAEWKSFMNLEK